jgi:hypothetical protein
MRLLCSAHTDLLAFLPMQWGEFSLTRDTLLRISIREQLLAPSIVLCTERNANHAASATIISGDDHARNGL